MADPASELTALQGFGSRDDVWEELVAIDARTLDRITAVMALVAVQAPLAGGMIGPMLDGIRSDVSMLARAWKDAEADLERLWPHLPSGLDDD